MNDAEAGGAQGEGERAREPPLQMKQQTQSARLTGAALSFPVRVAFCLLLSLPGGSGFLLQPAPQAPSLCARSTRPALSTNQIRTLPFDLRPASRGGPIHLKAQAGASSQGGIPEPDSLRQKYAREREAREKAILPTQVNAGAEFEDEPPTDYDKKDREFRARNGMVSNVDSEWADEAFNLQSAPEHGTRPQATVREEKQADGAGAAGPGLEGKAQAGERLRAGATFRSLGLSPELQLAAAKQGWDKPTDIQRKVIAAALAGGDVWAEAPTGSGKTAAFALPVIQRLQALKRARGPFASALVLAPTRELAVQTAGVFRDLARGVAGAGGGGLTIAVLHGGVAIDPQLQALDRGVDILVATPGRLLDILARPSLDLSQTRILVLDEADKLFAPAFAFELSELLALLPAEDTMQALLFSATFPYASRPRAQKFFGARTPLRITTAGGLGGADAGGLELGEDVPAQDAAPTSKHSSVAIADEITQRVIRVDKRDRTMLLQNITQTEGWERVLTFVATQYAGEHVAMKLRGRGFSAAALHGGLTQEEREARLEAFREARIQFLVATDVAARGLDVPGLPAVVNYDLPRSPADYTHRVGRTGRAGNYGVAVSFITVDTESHFRLIEQRHGSGVRIPRETVPGFEPKDKPSPAQTTSPAGGGGAGEIGGDVLDVAGVVPGVQHSPLGLAHDRMHGGVKGRKKSKKDKLREQAAREAARKADEGM